MDIQHDLSQSESKGNFYIGDATKKLAIMSYSKAGQAKFIIDHTEVSQTLRGKGAGKQLVEAAVQYARQHDVKIVPLCPFAKSVFEKNEGFKDVLF